MGNAFAKGWGHLLEVLGFGDKKATVILLGEAPTGGRRVRRLL